jgi:hypothetical protein
VRDARQWRKFEKRVSKLLAASIALKEAEPRSILRVTNGHLERNQPVKIQTIMLAAVLALSSSFAVAQSNGSGSQPGAATPDPAASSQNGKQRDTTGMAPNKSGSGTSTSGGSDANGDQGRDTKPSTTIPRKQ